MSKEYRSVPWLLLMACFVGYAIVGGFLKTPLTIVLALSLAIVWGGTITFARDAIVAAGTIAYGLAGALVWFCVGVGKTGSPLVPLASFGATVLVTITMEAEVARGMQSRFSKFQMLFLLLFVSLLGMALGFGIRRVLPF